MRKFVVGAFRLLSRSDIVLLTAILFAVLPDHGEDIVQDVKIVRDTSSLRRWPTHLNTLYETIQLRVVGFHA